MSQNAWDISTALFPVLRLVCNQTKQHGVYSGKYKKKSPRNAISETQIFKMSLDASALKNLCLWCKFQSRLLFIISLLLKNFLTALLLSIIYDDKSICDRLNILLLLIILKSFVKIIYSKQQMWICTMWPTFPFICCLLYNNYYRWFSQWRHQIVKSK